MQRYSLCITQVKLLPNLKIKYTSSSLYPVIPCFGVARPSSRQAQASKKGKSPVSLAAKSALISRAVALSRQRSLEDPGALLSALTIAMPESCSLAPSRALTGCLSKKRSSIVSSTTQLLYRVQLERE